MNAFTESIRFWETLHHLIHREGMRLIHLNEQDEVAWIEDDRREPYQIIRLAHKNYDWSIQLKKDMDRTLEKAKQVRKSLGLRQANVINVILAAYLPVDDYERFTSQALPLTAGGKNQYRTILIPMDDLKNRFFPLATEWKLANMPTYSAESYIEENEQEEILLQTLKHTVKTSMKKREEKERGIFLYGKPLFTFVLLGIILTIFASIEAVGSTTSTLTLVEFGAKFDPYILDGEWWRFFSAMFLHIGFLHLFMNSLALFYLGGAVERIFGTSRFILIYFIAGFIGSVSSFVFNDNVSAGASGAIFGCFGALLYFGLIHKRLFFRTMGMNVIVILAINLAFGFIVPMVDNGAHIGGLVGGFAASAIVGLPHQKGVLKKVIAMGLSIILTITLLLVGYQQDLDKEQISVIYYQLARESMEEDNPELAEDYLLNVVEVTDLISNDLSANAHFLLSYIQINNNEYELAEENLLTTIDKDPSFHQAYYNLALVYYEKQQYEEALEKVESALDIQADNDDYQSLRDELLELVE
ncbi:rhomboid family protein [Salipaludibacillus daqingensis]|uniref:rhomboid family protein n=1 Tax=Salipaludibacillus daqingensis TaxID=3041001 RepID=UPI0024746939|nr:rhomboid family intramembrane serine protease [Salipaludibacillus daqingensis]